jgi:DUF4097 and DUF4098 domain-containing protein YvlB
MFRKSIIAIIAVGCVALLGAAPGTDEGSREFRASRGGTLILDLEAGGSVDIAGTGGSSVLVDFTKECAPACGIQFEERGDDLEITTRFIQKGKRETAYIDLRIQVPRNFDVRLDSNGGGLSIDGVNGTFTGKTAGGRLELHDVRGEAKLTTMGGRIRLTDSELDGHLKTMGGQVLFENVVGDVQGKSMGGNVRYKNVQRRDGTLASPPRTGHGHDQGDIDESSSETVQISTMGGEIEIEDAPEGADVHTMGGNIEIKNAHRFVRAKTMGGDILIDSIDGWVKATTMAGDVEVTVTGDGGDVTVTSMTGDVDVTVPSGFGMDLDLEIAYTRNSRKEFGIDAPGGLTPTRTSDWDYEHGTPRKYIRSSGSVNGGGNVVKIKTINGDITIREGR